MSRRAKLISLMVVSYGLAVLCAIAISVIGAGLIHDGSYRLFGWLTFLGGGVWLGRITLEIRDQINSFK